MLPSTPEFTRKQCRDRVRTLLIFPIVLMHAQIVLADGNIANAPTKVANDPPSQDRIKWEPFGIGSSGTCTECTKYLTAHTKTQTTAFSFAIPEYARSVTEKMPTNQRELRQAVLVRARIHCIPDITAQILLESTDSEVQKLYIFLRLLDSGPPEAVAFVRAFLSFSTEDHVTRIFGQNDEQHALFTIGISVLADNPASEKAMLAKWAKFFGDMSAVQSLPGERKL